MDRHDRLHVRLVGIVALALHRVEEHLLAGVDPVSRLLVGARVSLIVGWSRRSGRLIECARDRRDFALGG